MIDDAYYQPLILSMADKTERLGIELVLRATKTRTDSQKQIESIHELTDKGVDAILVSPIDSPDLYPSLVNAQNKGIPIVNVGPPLDESEKKRFGLRCPLIGSDDYQGSLLLAHYAIAVSLGEGDLAILEGFENQPSSQLRKKGFLDGLKSLGSNVKVVDSQAGDWDEEKSRKVFAQMLVQHPNLKGLFAMSDDMAIGALKAISDVKVTRDILIFSYEYQHSIDKYIMSGKVLASVDTNQTALGSIAIDATLDLIAKKEVDPTIMARVKINDMRTLYLNRLG